MSIIGYAITIPNPHNNLPEINWDGEIHSKEDAEKELQEARDMGYDDAQMVRLAAEPTDA